jgi:phage terminase large subunit GpA-like protein
VLYVWELIPGRENHFLDCRVYARAAAAVLGIDRYSESDWSKLDAATAQAPRAPEPPQPTSPAPAAPQQSRTTPPHAQRQGWIPRRSGWLKGHER